MRNIFAVAGVVIKELYRRKDFYVLFILTVLICVVMAIVNIFNDNKIIRYLKELCLLLVWISSLVIAITTTARQIPAERENRTLLPLLAKPLTRTQLVLGKFLGCWIACGLVLMCFYIFFGVARREPRTCLAAAELFSGRVFALDRAGHGRGDGAARLARFCRAVVQLHDLFRRGRGHFAGRPAILTPVALAQAGTVPFHHLRDLFCDSASGISV